MNIVRRAAKEDLSGINSLLGQVLLVHHNGRPDLFKPVGQKYTDETLETMFMDDENPIFVCVNEENKVLGHCFCQTKTQKEGPATYAFKTLYIDDLCVDETSRNTHVGRTLYEYVKEYAKANGYYNVTLHAWECNPNACGFYSHLGLKIQQYTMEEIL